MLKAHHRRGDRDAAPALDRHPIRAHPPPLAARLDFARQLDRSAEQQQFLGQVVLPASGCEMIANVRRRNISSVRYSSGVTVFVARHHPTGDGFVDARVLRSTMRHPATAY